MFINIQKMPKYNIFLLFKESQEFQFYLIFFKKLINWKYYGDNNKLYYEPKPLTQRFTKPFYFTRKNMNINKYLTSAAKSIVRGGLNIIWQHCPHYLNNTINCRPNGEILNDYFSPPNYSIAYINHYTTKSTEEFAERLNRGDVIVKIDENYYRNRIYKYYFFFNSKTQKKLDLFKEKVKYYKENKNLTKLSFNLF